MAQRMSEPARTEYKYWHKEAIIYALDVETYVDSDGDGVGDFRGLTTRLDYLTDLGVTCLWLTPFYPTPNRDNGYDITDYCAVDPRLGTMDDFLAFCREVHDRDLRLMVDLVINHTSDQHPWFQQARSDPSSPYRGYYLWSDEPEPPKETIIYPGPIPDSVWSYDTTAGSFYRHQFYEFEPDLATGHAVVQDEVQRVMEFWLDRGVDAFRIDAARHLGDISDGHRVSRGDPHQILRFMRSVADARHPGIALMGETDAPPDQLADFFGDDDELHMVLNFLLDNFVFLAMARQQAEPLAGVINKLEVPPKIGEYANFLRNFDELDLERLTDEEREEVYQAFAPRPEMQAYGRGIRRRLAPMLGGDQRRIALIQSLLLSLPGVPVILYGDEIGMGDDLSLPERVGVRTPMQWSDEPNGGFSTAPRDRLALPMIDEGPYRYERVNVAAQLRDPESLLSHFRRAIHVRRQCPEMGLCACDALDADEPSVLAHCCSEEESTTVAVHNLGAEPVTVSVAFPDDMEPAGNEVLGNRDYDPPPDSSQRLELDGYGFRWFRRRQRDRHPERSRGICRS